MTYRIRGKRGKRWAAEMMSLATERFSPPPIFSLSLIRRRASFRCERSERAEPPPFLSNCQNLFRRHLHPTEREQLLAKVLEGCAEVINRAVNDEKPVVKTVGG